MTFLSLFLTFLMFLGAVPAYAEGPGSFIPAVSSQVGARVGITAAVQGTVQLLRPGQAGHLAGSGEAVHIGDVIETDAESQLQIILLDETVFTIGPESSMVIDEFVYDPTDRSGVVRASVTKGVFRFVTGQIARKKPSNMEVKVPTGTIGVRGTIVLGSAAPEKSLVILMGPGENNNTGDRFGSLKLTGEAEGKKKSVNVNRPGFGSELYAGKGPTPAFDARDQVMGLQLQLTPKEDAGKAKKKSGGKGAGGGGGNAGGNDDGGDGDGGSASSDAGQDTAAAGGSLRDTTSVGDLAQDAGRSVNAAISDGAEADVLQILDGEATFAQLRTVSTGQFNFKQTGVPLFLSNGSPDGAANYNIQLDIDFGARRIAGGNSRLVINNSALFGAPTRTFTLPGFSFNNLTGNAAADFNFTVGSEDANCSGSDCTVNLGVDFINGGGVAGRSLDHDVIIINPNQGAPNDRSTGAGQTQRQSGLS
ncbi:MAG: FecR family protein [Candidatus Omnitrophota bacterium]|nr:FecR family protein [Candidatus Omnitrophota bacterium]